MKIAMYKGPPTDFWHKIGHWFTCLWTRSIYSHCELVFCAHPVNGTCLCASSSARDGGVRLKWIDLSSGHWDVFDLPMLDEFEEAAAHLWFRERAESRYDWFGLLWFMLPIKAFNNPKHYFCSEAIAEALSLPKPHKFHPQRLLNRLKA